MDPSRWQEIKKIFDAARDCEPDDRPDYLAAACGDDDDLRREVQSLLDSFNDAGNFMEQPAVAEVADQISVTPVRKFSKKQNVAHYQIICELGTGGQGTVYKAQDTKLERTVALKLLPPDVAGIDDTGRKRFRREAQLASSLDHPNICTVHDLMEVEGATFIVMQFVAGRTIRQLVNGRPLEITTALRIAIQVGDALSAAHSKGIIHRDIKAHNIIISENGQTKILDFGLAKLIKTGNVADDETDLTAQGSPYGTPTYAAPEQSRGEKVDHRADIFSTGVLLYEMLTGSVPFQGKTAIEMRHAVLYDQPAPISEKRGSPVPAKLEAIVNRAISKDPANRFQQISDMRDDLLEVLRELPEAKGSSTETFLEGFKPTKLRHFPRWNLIYGLTAIAPLIIVVAILAYSFYGKRSTTALSGKDTILIADFTNTTGDAVFDDTLKQGLAIELQQSPFLNIFPDTRVRETLRQMERSTDDRVTVEIAREICQRNDLKALIAGSIAPLGSHYVITLSAINSRSGEAIARQQTEAESKEGVLKSLSSAANGIREKLGESLSSIQQSDIPIYQLTTPSLEALKSFALGFDRSNRGAYFESIPLFRRSTELDQNFAYGYSLLAGNYIIMNEPARASENAAKAFALKEKVSDREKLYITAVYYDYTVDDLDKTIEVLGIYNRAYPNDFRVSGNLSYVYLLLGQFDKAAAEARESVRLNPGISNWHVTLGTALIRMNRFPEAKEIFEHAFKLNLDDARMHSRLYQIAFIDGDAAAMQQQLDWARGLPEEYLAADLQTATAAYRGEWRQSQDFARRAIDLAGRVDVKEVASHYAAEQGLRAAVLGECAPAKNYDTQSLGLGRDQITLERVALAEAICGDSRAQAISDELSKQHPNDTMVNGLWLPMIHSAIELLHGNAAKAVELLNTTRVYEPAAEFWTHYLRGLAYLKSSRGSEAAVEFQQILSHTGEAPLSVLYPLSELGLARAMMLTNDVAGARRAYEDFLNIWKGADAELPVLQSARKEYANLKD